ncbi:MAG: glutathione S-transferase family protein [Bdellovibrionota bacterium]
MAQHSPIVLHSYRRCPFAMRVRMTLHEKDVPFQTIEEDLKNFSQDLKKHHPEAKVPVLLHEHHVLYESAIITEYLEDTFPRPSLTPEDPWGKAQTRLWTHWCNHIFKPHVDQYKYGESRSRPEQVLAAPQELCKDLEKLEHRLSDHDWLVGESFSLADIHVFPFFRQLVKATPRFSGLEKAPKSLEWLERICGRPSFQKTIEKKSS